MAHVWDWFWQICRGRPVTQFGFLPIPWSEVKAWADLMRIRPKAWELDALAMLDELWLSIQSMKGVTVEDLRGDDDGGDDLY